MSSSTTNNIDSLLTQLAEAVSSIDDATSTLPFKDVERRLQSLLALVTRGRQTSLTQDFTFEPEINRAVAVLEKAPGGRIEQPDLKALGLSEDAIGKDSYADFIQRLEKCLLAWLKSIKKLYDSAGKRLESDTHEAQSISKTSPMSNSVIDDELDWWSSLDTACRSAQSHVNSLGVKLTLLCLRDAKRRFAVSSFESESSLRELSDRVSAVLIGTGASSLPLSQLRSSKDLSSLSKTLTAACEHIKRSVEIASESENSNVDLLRASRLLWGLGREVADRGCAILTSMSSEVVSTSTSTSDSRKKPHILLSLPIDTVASIAESWLNVETAWKVSSCTCHSSISAIYEKKQQQQMATIANRSQKSGSSGASSFSYVSINPSSSSQYQLLPPNSLPSLISQRLRVSVEFRRGHLAFVDLLDGLLNKLGSVITASSPYSSSSMSSSFLSATATAERLQTSLNNVRSDLFESWSASLVTAGDPLDLNNNSDSSLSEPSSSGRQRWVRAVMQYNSDVDRLEQQVARSIGSAMSGLVGEVTSENERGNMLSNEQWEAIVMFFQFVLPWSRILRIKQALLPIQNRLVTESASLLTSIAVTAEENTPSYNSATSSSVVYPISNRLRELLSLRSRCDLIMARIPSILLIDQSCADPRQWRSSEIAKAHGLPALVDRVLMLTNAQDSVGEWLRSVDLMLTTSDPQTTSSAGLSPITTLAKQLMNLSQSPLIVHMVRARSHDAALDAIFGGSAGQKDSSTSTRTLPLVIRVSGKDAVLSASTSSSSSSNTSTIASRQDSSSSSSLQQFSVITVSIGPLVEMVVNELRNFEDLEGVKGSRSSTGKFLMEIPESLKVYAVRAAASLPLAAIAREALNVSSKALLLVETISVSLSDLKRTYIRENDERQSKSLVSFDLSKSSEKLVDSLLSKERLTLQNALFPLCHRSSMLSWLTVDKLADAMNVLSKSAIAFESAATKLSQLISSLVQAISSLDVFDEHISENRYSLHLSNSIESINMALSAIHSPNRTIESLSLLDAFVSTVCADIIQRQLVTRLNRVCEGSVLNFPLRFVIRDGCVQSDPPLFDVRSKLLTEVESIVSIAASATLPGTNNEFIGLEYLLGQEDASLSTSSTASISLQRAIDYVDESMSYGSSIISRWRPFEVFWKSSPATVAAKIISSSTSLKDLLSSWRNTLVEFISMRDKVDFAVANTALKSTVGCLVVEEIDMIATISHRVDTWLADLVDRFAASLAQEIGKVRQGISSASMIMAVLSSNADEPVPLSSLGNVKKILIDTFGSLTSSAETMTMIDSSNTSDIIKRGQVSASITPGCWVSQSRLLREGEALLISSRRDSSLPPEWRLAENSNICDKVDADLETLINYLKSTTSTLQRRFQSGALLRQCSGEVQTISVSVTSLSQKWQEDKPASAMPPGERLSSSFLVPPIRAQTVCSSYSKAIIDASDRLQNINTSIEVLDDLVVGLSVVSAAQGNVLARKPSLNLSTSCSALSSQIASFSKDVESTSSMWKFLQKPYEETILTLRSIPWFEVDPIFVRSRLDDAIAHLSDLPLDLKATSTALLDGVYAVHIGLLRLWRSHVLVLSELRSTAVQERHLVIIASILGLQPSSFTFSSSSSLNESNIHPAVLGDVLDSDLAIHEKELRVVLRQSQGELGIVEFLREISTVWEKTTWDAIPLRRGENTATRSILRGWDLLLSTCDDHIMSLSSMRMSPFFAPFAAQASSWEARLSDLRQLLDTWVDLQRTWVYLDGLFLASPDMKQQLPQEAQRFANVDLELAQAVSLLSIAPLVIAAPCLSLSVSTSSSSASNGLLSLVPASIRANSQASSLLSSPLGNISVRINVMLESLNRVQAGLSDFLERRRATFSRFYFLGDDDLLGLLGSARDPLAVERHLSAMFAGIATFEVVDSGSGADISLSGKSIQAIGSVEGERVLLSDPVHLYTTTTSSSSSLTLSSDSNGTQQSLSASSSSAPGVTVPLHEWLEAIAQATSAALASGALRSCFSLQADYMTVIKNSTGQNENGVLANLLSTSSIPCEAILIGSWVFWTKCVESCFPIVSTTSSSSFASSLSTTSSSSSSSIPSSSLEKVSRFLACELKSISTMLLLSSSSSSSTTTTENSSSTSRVARRRLEQGVVDLVHKRDVTNSLSSHSISSSSDFLWRSRMRAYMSKPSSSSSSSNQAEITVSMSTSSVRHSLEYHGIGERLVQTPLTDRAFLALSHALQLRLGGSPIGPAGTGKTETVKALGSCLGRFVLVFNADSTFDYRAMGRIFSGLCRSGAWGCIDEFNRLDEHVLSAISQQLLSIQQGMMQGAENVELLGKRTPLHPDVAVFVTMNPGYAGRSQLPDNLKALFRPIAMVSPDVTMIAAVMLFTQGFQDADSLSKKVSSLFSGCRKSLSDQPHYDFGLRALKAVLVQAGVMKRRALDSESSLQKMQSNSQQQTSSSLLIEETRLLSRSVSSSILPKLVPTDVMIFEALVVQSFPINMTELAVSNSTSSSSSTTTDLLIENLIACAAAVIASRKRFAWRSSSTSSTSLSSSAPPSVSHLPLFNIFPCISILNPNEITAAAAGLGPSDASYFSQSNTSAAMVAASGVSALSLGNEWFTKVMQVYETQLVRHGIVLLGKSGTGKSAAWRTVLDGMSLVDGIRSEAYVIDPKCLSTGRPGLTKQSGGGSAKEQFYGRLDPSTSEWKDGVFTSILRTILADARGEMSRRHWIVFDGDVDPEWAESLNSVLDDTRQLTLPSGERLVLPGNVRLVFEVDSLRYATLATVSRCGMVCFSDNTVSPSMLARIEIDSLIESAGKDEGSNTNRDRDSSTSLISTQILNTLAREKALAASSSSTDGNATTVMPSIALTSFGLFRRKLYETVGKALDFDLCNEAGFVQQCLEASVTGLAVVNNTKMNKNNSSNSSSLPIMEPSRTGLMSTLLRILRFGLTQVLKSSNRSIHDDNIISSVDEDQADLPLLTLRMRHWLLITSCWVFSASHSPVFRSAISNMAVSIAQSANRGVNSSSLPLRLPSMSPGQSLFDFDFSLEKGEWSQWASRVPTLTIDSASVFESSLVVPTIDTIRHARMLELFMASAVTTPTSNDNSFESSSSSSSSLLPPPVVLCGPPGSGKTMLLNSVLSSKNILKDDVLVSTLSFSSSTSIESIMRSIEQYCEYKKSGDGWTLQPVSSNTAVTVVGQEIISSSPSSLVSSSLSSAPYLVVFCDEINLPSADKYGTQRAISHIRNLTESGGFWYPLRLEATGGSGGGGGGGGRNVGAEGSTNNPKKVVLDHPSGLEPVWISLKRILFVGACNPPTDAGRVQLSNRFLRHTPIINVGYPSIEGLRAIYGTLITAILKQIPPLSSLSTSITNACIDVYNANHDRFSGGEPQCVYSPRELSRWVRALSEGLTPISRQATTTTSSGISDAATMLVRLWLHEGLRLFSDRLSSEEDRHWVSNTLDSTAQKYFSSQVSASSSSSTTTTSNDKSILSSIIVNLPVALSRPVYFTDWTSGSYVSVTHEDALTHASRRAVSFIGEGSSSSSSNNHQQLVVFDDALAYMLRIDRVLQQPIGHLLLAGASGAGKSLLTQFVCWMRGIATVSVRVSSRYTVTDFDKDLRSVMMRTGAYREPLAFIFDEGNVLSSAFLERMNSLLASGEVPGLFEGEEKAALLSACRTVWTTNSSLGSDSGPTQKSTSSNAFAADAAAAAKRLRTADLDSDDVVLRIFTQNVQRFLHVVFTVNPATASFTNRKTTSPALFNRCVVVWMGSWSPTAMAQVASSLLSNMVTKSLSSSTSTSSAGTAGGGTGNNSDSSCPLSLLVDSFYGGDGGHKYAIPKALSQTISQRSDQARSMLGVAMLSRQRFSSIHNGSSNSYMINNKNNNRTSNNNVKIHQSDDEYTYVDALSSLLSSLHSVTATLVEESTSSTGASSDSSGDSALARPFISPRDFVDMLNHFVAIFSEKQAQIDIRVKHVTAGLSRIRATEATVATLQASLAVKQRGLTAKTEAANIKLAQMLTDQKEAERRRTDSMLLRDQLAKMTKELATREATVASELSAAEPALREAQLSVQSINKAQLDELRSLLQPPQPVKLCLEAVLALLGTASTSSGDDVSNISWTEVRKVIKSTDFIPNVVKLRTDSLTAKVRQRVNDRYVNGAQNAKDFTFERINGASKACGPLYTWVVSQLSYASILERVEPLREEASKLIVEKEALATRAETVALELEKLEASIAKYTEEYALLVREAEQLRSEMASVETRVNRAVALISSLARERNRWDDAVKHFGVAKKSLASDCAVSAAFMAYAGWHDLRRRMKLESLWRNEAEFFGIPCRSVLGFDLNKNNAVKANADDVAKGISTSLKSDVIDLLSDANDRRLWQKLALGGSQSSNVVDDFAAGNAILLTRFNRFPFIIDPTQNILSFLNNLTNDRRSSASSSLSISVNSTKLHTSNGMPRASLLDTTHLKTLESAVRFGTSILLTDAENVESSMHSVLNRSSSSLSSSSSTSSSSSSTLSRVLVRVGDVDVDVSPSFRLFLFSKNATARITPDIASRVTVVNFSATSSSLADTVTELVLLSTSPALHQQRGLLLNSRAEADERLQLLEQRLLTELGGSSSNSNIPQTQQRQQQQSSSSGGGGTILDDDRVLQSLEDIKREAAQVEAERDKGAEVLLQLAKTSERYKGVSRAAISAFFIAQNLARTLECSTYRYSQAHFLTAVKAALLKSKKETLSFPPASSLSSSSTTITDASVVELTKSILCGIHSSVSRFLFEAHKRSWTLSLACVLAKEENEIETTKILDEIMRIGKSLLSQEPISAKSTSISSKRLSIAISSSSPPPLYNHSQTTGLGLLSEISRASKDGKTEHIPSMLTNAADVLFCQSSQTSALEDALAEAGEEQQDDHSSNIQNSASSSSSTSSTTTMRPPVVLLFCTPGADADTAVQSAASKVTMSSSTTLLRAAISVGSIESQTAAEQALSQAMRTGGWVLLRNVHLASVWAEQALRKAMASLIEGEGSGSGSTIVIHPTFRAILTIEVPMLLVSKSSSSQVSSMPRIPEQLLQESSKALIETPTGLRNALIRSALSLNSLTQKKEKPSSLETFSLRDRLLQLIVWVHATLLERRRFVAAGCGWSKSYDFCDADLTCALATVDTIISQQGLTALPTTIQAREAILKELSFMLLQAVHGARLETDTDALEFKNILDRVFVAAAIEDKSTHSLSADTTVRATLSSELSLLAWAESVVLDNVKPSVVGLMDNAEEGLLKTEAEHLLNKVETLSQL
jgi:hypothetical protein